MTDLDRTLNACKPFDHLVIERFLLYPQAAKSQRWSSMPACEAIGIVQSWAWRHHRTLHRVPAKVRIPHLKQIPPSHQTPRDEDVRILTARSHARDALAIALYLVWKLGYGKPELVDPWRFAPLEYEWPYNLYDYEMTR